MALVVVGLNHQTAPVEVRERFACGADEALRIMRDLCGQEGVFGAVVLSTCNRTEIYGSGKLPGLTEKLKGYFGDRGEVSLDEHLYILRDEEAAAHLFRVAASLNSLVLGEGQILRQVKDAFDLAQQAGTTDFFLNALFKRAISAGKKVRRETDIGKNNTSVSATAVAFAQETLKDLSGRNVLLIGAGKISELTARALRVQGVETVFVANRTYERAKEIAEAVGGKVIHFAEIEDYLREADIVISSTGAPHYVLREADVLKALPYRQGKLLFCLDLAVPRDIEPGVGELPGVALYNIDALQGTVQKGMEARQQEARRAQALLEVELERFRLWMEVAPTMARLREQGEEVGNEQLQTMLEKLPELTDEQKKALKRMTEKTVNKLLNPVIAYLCGRPPGKEREEALKLVEKMFGLQS